MRRYLLIMIALCGITSLMAFEGYSTSMGFHFGTSTGSGYSVRHWTTTNGFQGTIAAYAYGSRNPDYESSDFNGDDYKNARRQTGMLGLNYLWNLQRTKDYHFYIISGGSYSLQKVKRYYDPETYKWVNDNKWSVGAGPGFEMKLANRFHVSVELPITFNHKDDLVMYIPALGIYYYFR
ncbi:MAG: hypothetical protein PHU99_09205 [Candidatus Cloacimonetes bacterium]|nr:hypothetical protein [Candidatus Cloacimonadota bacterium]MDD3579207.1 hypothetical protein [Candidatus Cloacimonadota bacterium]